MIEGGSSVIGDNGRHARAARVTPSGVGRLVRALVSQYGLEDVVVADPGRTVMSLAELAMLRLETRLTALRIGDGPSREGKPGFPFVAVMDASSSGGWSRSQRALLSRSLVVAPSGVLRGNLNPGEAASRDVLGLAPIVILTTRRETNASDGPTLDALAAHGVVPTFLGKDASENTVIVIDRHVGAFSDPPDTFRVLAIVTTYNESDVIESTIQYLTDQGIQVHVIDNWSTDDTFRRVRGRTWAAKVSVERYPAQPTSRYEWSRLLGRVEEVAHDSGSHWVIHHDADERRTGPWVSASLRDALWIVDRSGFNAVDHTVLNFRPTDDQFAIGDDVEQHLRFYEFGTSPDMRTQIKAWKQGRSRVSLSDSGGHAVAFPGRRVFPYRFLLKHYPIRSQAHGVQKVLRDRQPRWDPRERERGWHSHYDDLSEGHNFVRDQRGLTEFDDGFYERHLIDLIAGPPDEGDRLPSWALRNRAALKAYEIVRASLTGSLASRISTLTGSRALRRIGLFRALKALKKSVLARN
jgi:Glycosyl transferase family 2